MTGRCLAITTSVDRGSRLGDVAIMEGLEPVLLPCIEVVPAPPETLQRSRDLAEKADLLVVTSSRAVTSIWPETGMPDVPSAAVGPETAAAVRAAGGSIAVVGHGGSEDLLARLEGTVSGLSIFFPHATGADYATTVEALERSGAHVSSMAVYETMSIAPGPDPVDAALFGSPSAVSGWSRSRSFEGLVLAAIGDTTGAALIDAGHPPDLVSPSPDFELLIATLARYLRDRSPV